MSNIYRIKYDDCQTVYQVINTRWDLSQPTSAFNRLLPEWTKQNTIEPIRVPISKARFCFATLAMTSFHQDHGFLRKHSRTFFFYVFLSLTLIFELMTNEALPDRSTISCQL